MKRIAIIGTNGLPGRYGGWDQLLEHLTLHLNENFHLNVYTSSYDAVKGLKEYNGAKLKIIPLKANGIQSIFYDGFSMFHSLFYSDILLVLGTSGCIFLPLIKLFGKKIILNPDGAEWKRGKWNHFAKWFLKTSEDIGLRYADTIVADNKIIQDYIFKTYRIKSELIAYGGDNAIPVPLTFETQSKYGISVDDYAFKVCRIEPENNIDLILEAFINLDFKLILIGNWKNSKYGISLKKKYSTFNNLVLLDPIYHQKTLDELRSNCKIYIHGHSVGGTNPSLVEAMNLGLCCVTYDVDYNRETTENKAIYFKDSNELRSVVEEVINNEIENHRIRNDMFTIAKTRYTWSLIIDKYKSLFS
jgi:glycosyltransferase involved in cell wall biosynthesis